MFSFMPYKTWKSFFLNLFAKVLALELLIFFLAFLYCWFWGGKIIQSFADALLIIGGVVLAFGVFTYTSRSSQIKDSTYQYSRTVGVESQQEKISRDSKDVASAYAFMIILGLAGILAIGISIQF